MNKLINSVIILMEYKKILFTSNILSIYKKIKNQLVIFKIGCAHAFVLNDIKNGYRNEQQSFAWF